MSRKLNTKVLSNYPNKIYSFICEDEKSMCYYLNGLKPYLKSNIKIDINHSDNGNTAKKVYESAKNKLELMEKHKAAYPKGFEIVACFDKDDNKISDIYNIMKNKKDSISKIYNNPCYEYWLYLHTTNKAPTFSDSDDCAKNCLKQINSTYNKQIPNIKELKNCFGIFEILKNDFPKAVKNAYALHFLDYDTTYTNAQIILDEIVDKDKLANCIQK